MRRSAPRRFSPLLIKTSLVAVFVCGAAFLLSARRPAETAKAERHIRLGSADGGSLYAITISAKDPAQLSTKESVEVSIEDARGTLVSKRLHSQDLDFYVTVHPRARGPVNATLRTASGETLPAIVTDFHQIHESGSEPVAISAMPNDTWQTAQPVDSARRFMARTMSGLTRPPPATIVMPIC